MDKNYFNKKFSAVDIDLSVKYFIKNGYVVYKDVYDIELISEISFCSIQMICFFQSIISSKGSIQSVFIKIGILPSANVS